MILDRSSAPAPGPVRMFEFPAVHRRALRNGMTILTARHGALPLVTIRAIIDAGAAAERAGEEGMAYLLSHALEGGTAQHTADELAWELERLGAQLETSATWDALSLSITTTADRLGSALDLLAAIIRGPSLPEREVERLRGEQLAEILRRATEPRGLADDAAVRHIFAADSTYARPLIGRAEHVSALTRDGAAAYHARQFTPESTALVIVGAVDAGTAEQHVERAFGGWSGTFEPTTVPSAVQGPARTTIFLVDRASAVQSELRIGHVGVPRHHQDYYPLLVLNAIVGGAFTSRLNLTLREKHGFTYGVRSGFAFRRAAGPFIVQTAVASDVTARAIEEALRELNSIRDSGVTDDEVRAARDFLAGTLPLEMQTTEQLASRVAELHTFSLPANYFDSYREAMQAVTRAEVERVAREHLHPDRLAIVVVGNAAAVAGDLKALNIGEVLTDG